MPLFRGTIHKYLEGTLPDSGWVNTYHINAASESAAMEVLRLVKNVERQVHWNNIEFDRLSIRQASGISSAGIQETVAEQGDRDASGENFLPLFCTVRVVCTDAVNRPDQKYLRCPINENEQDNGILTSGAIAFLTANYCADLIAIDGVVSSSAVPYTSVAAVTAVQNRQRGWHRRTRPGFKRGWVPA